MSQPVVTVDESTYRIYPRNAPEHDDLDGLEGHTPSATGWPVGKMARTDGDGNWEIIDTPSVDPYTAEGAILAVTKYNPATVANLNVTSTIADYAPVQLAVSFTVPASGKVLVQLDASHLASASTTCFWFLRNGGVVVPGSYVAIDATSATGRRSATILIEGLTPAASVTYTWAGQALAGQTSTLRVGGGDTAHASNVGGQATMIVRDAPF
jgi:hypothetical protein